MTKAALNNWGAKASPRSYISRKEREYNPLTLRESTPFRSKSERRIYVIKRVCHSRCAASCSWSASLFLRK
jgi:hypothetical protein